MSDNPYFFDSPESIDALRVVVNSWKGTPFKHKTVVKGIGVDCIHFVVACLVEVGYLRSSIWAKVPDYPRDWHLHRDSTLLNDMLLRYLNVEECSRDDLRDGDLVLYRFGQSNAHAALYLDGKVYQSVEGRGVMLTNLSANRDFRKRAIRRVYRLRVK